MTYEECEELVDAYAKCVVMHATERTDSKIQLEEVCETLKMFVASLLAERLEMRA